MTNRNFDALIAAAFRIARSSAEEMGVQEFVFHLRDCGDDLARLAELWHDPSQCSEAQAKEALDGLLLHAAGHIVRAARLYGGFIDTFAGEGEIKR